MTPELLEELEQILRDHYDWRNKKVTALMAAKDNKDDWNQYTEQKMLDFEARLKKAKIKITKK